MKEVILGMDARCKHGVLNELNGRCAYCEWEGLLVSRKLPFDVRFVGTGPLEKDGIYTVVGVVTSGTIAKGPIPGLLLADDGKIASETYEPAMFSLHLEKK